MVLFRVLTWVALLLIAAAPVAARTITDSAGRVVEIPDQVNRVFAAGPPASIIVYTLNPDVLTGWPRALGEEERPFIAAPYRDLPETGRLTGRGGEASLERMLASRPDLIVDFGSVRETYIDLANRVQAQTGIPYILIDGRFDNTPQALRLLGDVLGVPERGERLATDADTLFKQLDSLLKDTAQSSKPRVYLARGPDGLETGLKGSINAEIIERAGGSNVANPGDGRQGIVQTSLEQIIVANPDTIITWDRNFYDAVWNDPLWAGIEALRRQRVFLSPTVPFGWIDRPPSVNRLMGLRWLTGLFYPDRWNRDLAQETSDFYSLFYHVALSNEQLDRLLPSHMQPSGS